MHLVTFIQMYIKCRLKSNLDLLFTKWTFMKPQARAKIQAEVGQTEKNYSELDL